MPIKLSDALQGMKARIADLDSANPSFDILPAASNNQVQLESASADTGLATEASGSGSYAERNGQSHQSIDTAAPGTTAVLKLSEIKVAPDRIRQYFDSEKTASLVQSIQRYGFRGVLWVRLVEGNYHLVAGGRRYAACSQAGIEAVPVEIWQISNAEAIQLELLENFQREDLNPIEETEGILRMLEVTLNLPRPEIIALLNRKSRQQRSLLSTDTGVRKHQTSHDLAEQPQDWQTIEDLFAVIGRFSPESFRTHRLPLLNLPHPLITAVQTGQIEYSKARLIARVKDMQARDELLNQAIAANWSRQQITQQIHELTAAPSPAQAEQAEFQTRVKAMLRRLEGAALSGRTLKKAGKLLTELEEMLKQ